MALTWREDPGGRAAVGYRIRRVADGAAPWRLEAAPFRLSSLPGREVATSFHPTLRDAMYRAETLEAERRTRGRLRGYVIIGVVAALAFGISASIISGIPLFVTAIVTAYVALRSFVNAIATAVGDAWNWTRDGGMPRRSSRADRLMERWIAALEGPPDWTAAEAPAPVVVLDPSQPSEPRTARRRS